MQTQQNNPMICDYENGTCKLPVAEPGAEKELKFQEQEKPVKAIYFTDPICSSCWGIEPQLRKLKLEYGDSVEFEYRMGGLLPDWNYNSGGISKPSDVARHWDHVSHYYDMPIDGDVWLENPLDSSYPPSIAFKAAQMQDDHKAVEFLRAMREMVFMQKKNITKWEHLTQAAERAGLNVEQLKTDFEDKAKKLFKEDLKLAKQLGVKGFPTILFINKSGNPEIVYGSKPYEFYEAAILKINSSATKSGYQKNWEVLFQKYHSLTAKEFSTLSGIPKDQAEKLLNRLFDEGALEKLTIKNGSMWTLKQSQ